MAQLSLQSRAYIRGAEEKPPASLSGYKSTDLSPGDRAAARIQLSACQSQVQLNYTPRCSAKQPLWQPRSPAGPCPEPPCTSTHSAPGTRHGGAKLLHGCHAWPRFSPVHVQQPKSPRGRTDKSCTVQVPSESSHTQQPQVPQGCLCHCASTQVPFFPAQINPGATPV